MRSWLVISVYVGLAAASACEVPCKEAGNECVYEPEGGVVFIRSRDDYLRLDKVTRIEGDLVVTGIDEPTGFSNHLGALNGRRLVVNGAVRFEDNAELDELQPFLDDILAANGFRANHNPELQMISFSFDEQEDSLDLEVHDAPELDTVHFGVTRGRLVLENTPSLTELEYRPGGFDLPADPAFPPARFTELAFEATGLERLSIWGGVIVDTLIIKDNPHLPYVSVLSGFDWHISSALVQGNPMLHTLGPLLLSEELESARIVDNARLSACEPASLARLTGIEVEASGNDGDACDLPLGAACDDAQGMTCYDGGSMECMGGFCALPDDG